MKKRLWEIIKDGGVVVSNTPEDLWENACRYFKWCDDNPVESIGYVQSGNKAGSDYEITNSRPYSLVGLFLFCGINSRYFNDLLAMDEDNLYHAVAERIAYIIYEQNFSAAAVGNLSASFMNKALEYLKPQEQLKPVTIEIISCEEKLELSEYAESEVVEEYDHPE